MTTKKKAEAKPDSAEQVEPVGSHASNQLPVVVTFTQFDIDPLKPLPTYVQTAQPLVPIDGGDGSRTTMATKFADQVWNPFFPFFDVPPAGVGYVPPHLVPGTQVDISGDNTATIAAGLAQI